MEIGTLFAKTAEGVMPTTLKLRQLDTSVVAARDARSFWPFWRVIECALLSGLHVRRSRSRWPVLTDPASRCTACACAAPRERETSSTSPPQLRTSVKWPRWSLCRAPPSNDRASGRTCLRFVLPAYRYCTLLLQQNKAQSGRLGRGQPLWLRTFILTGLPSCPR